MHNVLLSVCLFHILDFWDVHIEEELSTNQEMEDSFLSLLTVESADDDLYGGKVERIFGRTRMEESCKIDRVL